jgi:signal transduction histidine kinase
MATSSPPDLPAKERRLAAFRPRSLRARLTIAAALTVAAVLTIVWFLLGAMFEDHIERLMEEDLNSRLLEVASGLGLDANGEIVLSVDPSDPRYQRPAGGAYWRLSENGQTILRSLSLWDSDIVPSTSRHVTPTGVATEALGPNGSTVFLAERNVTLADATRTRVVRIAVALDSAAIKGLQRSFGRQAIITLAVIGLALSLGTWIQSSFGLRPLREVRAQLARVRAGEAQRMKGVFPTEVAPLVEDLNKLLERQEDLVRRARERAGDLAHGLKTPLTILQIEARKVENHGGVETAAAIREQIEAMRRHVERELSRARMSGASAGGGVQVDAHRTIGRLIGIMQRMPRGEAIDWRNDLPNDARLLMDPDDFGEIVGNLLDNARKHAKSAVRISEADGDGGRRRIDFDDDGPGLSARDCEAMLQRGNRASAATEGSGLGLSIVIEALERYGLTLEMAESPLGGLRVSFRAPGAVASGAG